MPFNDATPIYRNTPYNTGIGIYYKTKNKYWIGIAENIFFINSIKKYGSVSHAELPNVSLNHELLSSANRCSEKEEGVFNNNSIWSNLWEDFIFDNSSHVYVY